MKKRMIYLCFSDLELDGFKTLSEGQKGPSAKNVKPLE